MAAVSNLHVLYIQVISGLVQHNHIRRLVANVEQPNKQTHFFLALSAWHGLFHLTLGKSKWFKRMFLCKYLKVGWIKINIVSVI